jgi:hypothetical protein
MLSVDPQSTHVARAVVMSHANISLSNPAAAFPSNRVSSDTLVPSLM